MKQWFSQILSKLLPAKQNRIDYFIGNSGLDCLQPDGTTVPSFDWADVVKIEVCKLDLLTYDEVAVLFTTTKGLYEVREEHSAFQELFSLLKEQFDIPIDWYFEVIQNPFELNHRVLYEKSTSE